MSMLHTTSSRSGGNTWFCWMLCVLLVAHLGARSAESSGQSKPVLVVEITPRFEAEAVELGIMGQTNAAGQVFSVTRLDMLLSGVALRRSDGLWIEATNNLAYISLGEKRNKLEITGLPPGRYDRLSFRVGLEEKVNHADPAQYPAGHPLNPNVNGLHWGWQGGYVFLALEGRWKSKDGETGGYSYHLGNDFMLTTVDMPLEVDFQESCTVGASLHLNRLLGGLPQLVFDEENSVTHARAGDALALRLQKQLRDAFSADETGATNGEVVAASKKLKVLMAKSATPYRFTFARQFPPPSLPQDNPLTEEGVELGRKLFHEARLSVNNTQSCASCHLAEAGFTDGQQVSIGAEGVRGTRNSMPLFNLAWKQSFFWDGRAPSLREQVLMPIQDPVEMHESLTNVVTKLKAIETYPVLFERAFGTQEIDADRVARALEQFLLTIVSYRSKFDRAMQGRESFTKEEKRGFELFVTEYDPRRGFYGADCFHCHGGPMFSNLRFANNGLEEKPADLGLGEVTRREFDLGRFAVPSLRNIAVTAPYMHDGRFKTLEEVVEHYVSGVKRSATLDPNLAKHPAGGVPLSPEDKQALVAFMKTLTDETYQSKQEASSR